MIVKQNQIETEWADADENYSRRTQNLIRLDDDPVHKSFIKCVYRTLKTKSLLNSSNLKPQISGILGQQISTRQTDEQHHEALSSDEDCELWLKAVGLWVSVSSVPAPTRDINSWLFSCLCCFQGFCKNFVKTKKTPSQAALKPETFIVLFCLCVPGLVSEQESEVSQERACHAGQQKRLAPQVVLGRRDGGGAADRTAPGTAPKRLPVLGQRRPLQVKTALLSHPVSRHLQFSTLFTHCTASVLTCLLTRRRRRRKCSYWSLKEKVMKVVCDIKR